MLVELIVDPDACIGSGECVALDPEVIELDHQGIAQVIVAEVEEERAKLLCDTCPIGAISIARS
jgi:ferredoxin